MEKKDSAPTSRSPAGASPRAHPAGLFSTKTRSRAASSRRERLSSGSYSIGQGDGDSPRNPVKFRSLKGIIGQSSGAEGHCGSLKFTIKDPPRSATHSTRTAKRSGAESRGGSLKFRVKVRPGYGIHSRGLLTSVSSLGTFGSLSNDQMEANVLAFRLKQKMVNDDYKASLRAGSGGPVVSQPGTSGPSRPKRAIGPDPGRQAPKSRAGSSEKPKNAEVLQSREGRGGPDNPAGIGGPGGSRSGPGEPSRDATETSAKKPEKKVRFREPIIENEW